MNTPKMPDCPSCHSKLTSIRGSWPSSSRPEWGGQVLYCSRCDLGLALVAYSKTDLELLRYTRGSRNALFVTTDSPSRPHELFDPQRDGRFAPAKVAKMLAEAAEMFPQPSPAEPPPLPEAPITTVFLEIVFQNRNFPFEGRDVVEDALDEALRQANLGEVSGGGGDGEACNVDVEVTDLERGLSLLRRKLLELGSPSSTVINQYKPDRVVHRLQ